jgi:hypothetical protein
MPASSSPRFSRGFGPLLGSGYPDQNMRVSDAERQAVADRLGVHYGDGRLDQAEFDERVSQAMSAKTRADLNGLLDDLPEHGPAGASGVPDRSGRTGQVRQHRHGHGLLVLAAIVVIAVAAVHAVAWFAVTWLWLGAVAVIALVATGHLGHHHHERPRPDQDR